MKVTKNKFKNHLNNLEPLTNLNDFITQAKKIHNHENQKYKRKQLFISTNDNTRLKKNYTYYPNRFPSLNSKLYNNEKKSQVNLNIIKKIKEIRRTVNKSDQLYDPFMRNKSKIPFDSKKADIVFDGENIIQIYKRKKVNKLINQFDSIYNFYKENKEIAKDNLITKLLNNESKKLTLIESKKSKTIEDEIKREIIYKNNFDEYIKQQRIAMRSIEKTLTKIEDKYRELLLIKRKENDKMNLLIEEMEKKLEQIEDLRVYAKFINDFLDGEKKFDKPILKTDIEFNKKNQKNIYIEQLVKETIYHYQFLFDSSYEKNNNHILELFKDPYIFISQYPKFENLILKKLEIQEQKQKDKKRVKLERMETIIELRNQLKFYEKEYKYYDENLKKIIEEYSFLVTSKIKDNSEIIDIIKNFHSEICLNNNSNVLATKISFHKQKTMKIEEIIKELIFTINNIEKKINGYINNLSNYEINDPIIFNPIINQIKKENKLTKQIDAKNKIEEEIKIRNLLSKKKFEKIIIQSRKTLQPPFRLKTNSNNKCKNKYKEKEDLDLLFY